MERWNTHLSTTVEQELFGLPLRLFQNPNSYNLGTTVWDASIVLAKYLEKNSAKGLLSSAKVANRRCLELGSGVGLGGIAFALLGCHDVTLTDTADLLPLLQQNVDANISPAAVAGTRFEGAIGNIQVRELDWSSEHKMANVQAPYDYVIAADCVYHENHLGDLLDTILKLIDHKTTVILVNELRSTSIDAEFREQFGKHFTLKKLPLTVQHPVFQHPDIHIFLLKRRKNL